MSTLRLSEIQSGFEKAKDLGTNRDTFEIEGISITLRTITRPESEAIQAKATQWIAEGSKDILPYLNTQKYETLARSIERIGEIDLTNVEFVEVEDEDPESETGVKKIEAHAFVLRLLNTWNEEAVEVCWRKYEDLVFETKRKVREGIEFVDKEAELEKLEARVANLRKELGVGSNEETREKPAEDLSEDDVRNALFSTVTDMDVDGVQISEPEADPEQGKSISGESEEDPREDEEMAWELDDEAALEHERLMRQRQKADPSEQGSNQSQGSNEKAEEARALRQKRRPLNQSAPRMHAGNLPESDRHKEPPTTTTYTPEEETPDEFVDSAPVHLGAEGRQGD